MPARQATSRAVRIAGYERYEAKRLREIRERAAYRYSVASDRAASKRVHSGPRGSLELSGPAGVLEPDLCSGQLRTAYTRTRIDGRSKWEPVGVHCGECSAFWTRP